MEKIRPLIRINVVKYKHTVIFLLFLCIRTSVCAQETFRDQFNTVSYSNNDGTQNFSSDWVENGQDTNNGPTAQYISINSNFLLFRYLFGENIRRTADLSGATTATLTFDWQTANLTGGQALIVQMSSNGGTSYTTIGSFNGSTSNSFSANISAYISSNTTIRFGYSGTNWDSNDAAAVDNLTITANVPTSPNITVEDVSINEDAGNAVFTVTHNDVATSGYNVDYSITGVSATEGEDYTTGSGQYTGTLSFNGTVGDTQQITVQITNDDLVELNETYTIQFTATTDSSVDITDTALGSIIEPDNPRAYEERYAMNLAGNFKVLANTNLECVSGCPGTATTNNPSVVMGYADIDGDINTENSSSATLTMPAGATVVWAGLYWGGLFGSTNSGITNPSGLNSNEIKFKAPGSANYSVLNASIINAENTSFSGWTSYLAFAEVTSLVQTGGSGDYFAADIALATGSSFTGPYGGWNLVVIYEDSTERSRNIAIWDGFDFFGFGANDTFTVTGLLTPSSGVFETHAAYFAFDGEANRTGDFVSIEGTALSNGLNPNNNTLNGTISEFGVDTGTRNPNYAYSWGIDSDVFDASGLVANNATDMDVTLGSSSEGVWGGVFVTSNEIAFPSVASKTFSPSTIIEGQESTVVIQIDNPINGVSLSNFTLTDVFPDNMVISSTPNASSSCGGSIIANSGDDSFTVSGVVLPAGGSCTFTFNVVTSIYGSYTNTISQSDVSNDQNIPISGETSGILIVNIQNVITNRRITYRVKKQ